MVLVIQQVMLLVKQFHKSLYQKEQFILPNHPFITGQKVTLTKPNIANSEFDVSPNDSAYRFI